MFDDAYNKLRSPGTVGVLPCDTIYGLVARATDKTAVARLYKVKHRDNKPGTIIASSIEQLVDLGIKYRYLKAVEQFWPGAVSVIIPCGQELAYLHLGKNSLAVRIPNSKGIRDLLTKTGPLLTSSANLKDKEPAMDIAQAQAYFGDKVDFYEDGGDLYGRKPSTVIRVVDDSIKVLRPGAVMIDEFGKVLDDRTENHANCPFCLGNDLFKGSIIYRSKKAFLTRNHFSPNNYLIIPFEHIESPLELPDNWWHDFKENMSHIPKPLNGYNISINIGKQAGQTLKHLHFWIIPRKSGYSSSGKGLASFITESD
jgi:L-threonylcarbamoyladenylate synthase